MVTRQLERRLEEYYSDRYRRIWVQYCTLSKGRSEYRAVITLFPIQGHYTMIFTPTINAVDYETILSFMEESLPIPN